MLRRRFLATVVIAIALAVMPQAGLKTRLYARGNPQAGLKTRLYAEGNRIARAQSFFADR